MLGDLQVAADHESLRVHAVADPDLFDLQVVGHLVVAALAGTGEADFGVVAAHLSATM
jgi:hypothetical protein